MSKFYTMGRYTDKERYYRREGGEPPVARGTGIRKVDRGDGRRI